MKQVELNDFFFSGLLAPAILMSSIGLVGCNYVVVVVLLTFAVGLGGFCMGGFNVNHLDLAPNFSGRSGKQRLL